MKNKDIVLLEKLTGKKVILKESDNPDLEFGGTGVFPNKIDAHDMVEKFESSDIFKSGYASELELEKFYLNIKNKGSKLSDFISALKKMNPGFKINSGTKLRR